MPSGETQMSQQRFSLDHLLQQQGLADRVPLHLAPDGRRLAITLRDVRRSRPTGEGPWTPEGVPTDLDGSRIVIVDTATGVAQEPFPSGSISWAPHWSPDGERLAGFVQHEGHACLAVWGTDTGAVHFHRQALVRPCYGFEGPLWMPDSRGLVLKLCPADPAANDQSDAVIPERGAVSVEVLSFDPAAAEAGAGAPEGVQSYDSWQGDLALVDAVSGEVRRLARGWKFVSFRVAPDGRAVAAMRLVADNENPIDVCFDLVAVAVADGAVHRLAPRVQQEYGYWLNWSPDSTRIAYLDVEAGRPSELFVVAADGSEEPRPLASDAEMRIPVDEYYLSPRWSLDSRTIYCLWGALWAFAADGSSRRRIAPEVGWLRCWIQHHPTTPTIRTQDERSVLVTTADSLARVDPETGVGELLAESGCGLGVDAAFHHELAPDGSACYLATGALRKMEGEFRVQQELISWSPDLSQVRLATKRLIEYRTVGSGREKRQAGLWLPPDYQEGQRLPVIVDLYPGVRFATFFAGSSMIAHPQLLASRGYAMLHPDALAHGPHMLRQLAGEVVPAVNHLVELGIADPERIGLFGHSRGGHAALGLITQTDVFRAAVVSAGKITLTSYGAHPGDYVQCETGIYACGGTPWEKREAYLENSPFFHLDRVRTPLLVIAGTSSREEKLQARQTYGALKRLGQRVELRLYKDEDHDPGAWTEPSLRDVVERIFAWYDVHLRS
jgi:dipeptidyl aminopeptidase/acylaminoacyl peptidase